MKSCIPRSRWLGAIAAMTLASSTARGDDLEASLRVITSSTNPPQIEATVRGPMRPAEDHWLGFASQPRVIATEVRSDHDGSVTGPEPIALALVYCGQTVWIGTSDYEPGEHDWNEGVLHGFEELLDAMHLPARLPIGSTAMAISYGTGARVEFPRQSIAKLAGSALGNQLHYRDNIGTDLVAGVELGVAALEKDTSARKLMMIVNDGHDTNDSTAVPKLRALATRIERANIHVVSVVYMSRVSPEGSSIVNNLTRNTFAVSSIDGIHITLERFIDQNARYYVEFPVEDLRTGARVPFDGRDHEVEFHAGDEMDWMSLSIGTHCRFDGDPARPWIFIVPAIIGLIPLSALRRTLANRGEGSST